MKSPSISGESWGESWGEAWLENTLSRSIDLNGTWQFKLGDSPWRTIRVPSAWEASDTDKRAEGPAVYRRKFRLTPSSQPIPGGKEKTILECDAISFAATVRINGHTAGTHTGLWSRWQMDISAHVRHGENDIEIEVWKPGETRHKLRESLAGFLPDVCNTFGGIWQGIRIREMGPAFSNMRVALLRDGRVRVMGRCLNANSAMVRAELCVTESHQTIQAPPIHPNAHGWFDEYLDSDIIHKEHGAHAWHPAQPKLSQVMLTLHDNGEPIAQTARRIGFCHIDAQGDKTLLNGVPVHLRGVLDWGWDEKRLCPTPTRVEVRRMFAKARALGFNLWKLCLFIPDDTFFDVADEAGMLIWLELPLWLPVLTNEARALALREYDAILRRVHHHPCIVIASLGCELDATVAADFVEQLRALVKSWLPNALLCDNSGSSEAYAAVAQTQGDFFDYHFYADSYFFRPLVQHFDRAYQARRPWIYGEFCDADTLRDWRMVAGDFWTHQPVTMQRDELCWAREHAERLALAGVNDNGKALTEIGRAQATSLRKFIIEQTRLDRATGGYVITGWRDTPITTSGIVDDVGGLKFSPRDWRLFNADRVLLLDRERRRVWLHGGDRPVQRDPYSWWVNEPIELHIALANGADAVQDAKLYWHISDADGQIVHRGQCSVPLVGSGEVTEVAMVLVPAPAPSPAPAPAAGSSVSHYRITALLKLGKTTIAQNAWSIWVVPLAAALSSAEKKPQMLDEPTLRAVAAGARRFVWLDNDSPLTKPRPFWREAIHVFTSRLERLAGLGRLPHADLRFYGVATDYAIDLSELAATAAILTQYSSTKTVKIDHLWRRFDARQMCWHAYAIDVHIGAGLLRLSTLRFTGGLGDQPNTIATNPIGAWLLERFTSV